MVRKMAAAVFLTCNGLILLAGEQLRRRASGRQELAARLDPARLQATVGLAEQGAAGQVGGQQLRAGQVRPTRAQRRAQPAASAADARLASLAVGEAVLIGSAQILAFFAGISRSGVTMVAGLLRTTEELLGLPLLGQAADRATASMRAAFRL